MKKQFLTLMLAAALLAACGGATPAAPTSQAADLPSFDQATVAPKPTQTPAPTATLQPTVTVAPTRTPAPVWTQVPLPEFPLTPIADEDYWAKFPKDEQGRVIGGKQMPVLNYTPTMVTGKPCPRVKTWTTQQINDHQIPYTAMGLPSDLCVLQNAIDDYVRALGLEPAFAPPTEWPQMMEWYRLDPVARRVLDPIVLRDVPGHVASGEQPFWVCDKPVYWLIEFSPIAPIASNSAGMLDDGTVITFNQLLVAKDLEPYRCESYRYKGRELTRSFVVERSIMKQGVNMPIQSYSRVVMYYNRQKNVWLQFSAPGLDQLMRAPDYLERAEALWRDSPIKP
jgi:hypothetical protein